MARIDGRASDELRPTQIKPGFLAFADGSSIITMGLTKVICSVSTEGRVPPFLRGTGTGWITAEYAMLPRSTLTRTPRESVQGRIGGRTQEIQRLIGRSLRAIVDLPALGEITLLVDCDVIQADGGTRTAAITGSYVALYQALLKLLENGRIPYLPLKSAVAAASVGIVGGETLLDLCYEEDSKAEVDFNVVMTGMGEFVEIQGTAEGKPFTRHTADALLDMAQKGVQKLLEIQQKAIEAMGR